MTDIEINEVVMSIQSKLVEGLNKGIQVVRNIPSEQLLSEMKRLCEDEYTQLYEVARKFGEKKISRFVILSIDDVWQNFAMKKLPWV
jgi:hypothetical protein